MFRFLSWHRLLESHILLFVQHSLPQSEILQSKLVWPLLSQASSLPSENCTGWFQRFDCFTSPAKPPSPHMPKSEIPCSLRHREIHGEHNSESSAPLFIFFHKIHVVVNVSFPFMAPFTRVTHSSIRATLSSTIGDSTVQISIVIALSGLKHPLWLVYRLVSTVLLLCEPC